MSKLHVKVDDNVYILRGKDAGKSGKVLAAYPKTGQVIVEGVNIVVKHKKAKSHLDQGGRIEQPGKINHANVMLVCPKCKKPTKTGKRFEDVKGENCKVRYCKACGETIDAIGKNKEAK